MTHLGHRDTPRTRHPSWRGNLGHGTPRTPRWRHTSDTSDMIHIGHDTPRSRYTSDTSDTSATSATPFEAVATPRTPRSRRTRKLLVLVHVLLQAPVYITDLAVQGAQATVHVGIMGAADAHTGVGCREVCRGAVCREVRFNCITFLGGASRWPPTPRTSRSRQASDTRRRKCWLAVGHAQPSVRRQRKEHDKGRPRQGDPARIPPFQK